MSKLRKLKNASFDELRVRGSQALATSIERAGWSGKLPNDKQLLRLLNPRLASTAVLHHNFTQRPPISFFSSFESQTTTIATLKRHWPDGEKTILQKAAKILEGSFDLLAFRDLNFGSPINWHLEPLAGKQSPLVHWSRLNYLDPKITGDKKIIWELNRHQYFVTLGQAWWLTGDERYPCTFATHITEWMDQNPPKLGVNWASSLEVAFRSISWLWALHFFRNSGSLTPELFARILQFLYVHARHLETYLSTYFSPNTHLTGEALGLFYLGSLLPEFRDAKRWRNTGLQILLAQAEKHVQPDGVYFEQSSYYHRYTTDFYLHLWILLRRQGEATLPQLAEKLQSLLDHLMYITRPDGTTPLFGDDDGGRLMMLDHHAGNDFRSTLSTGAAVFEDPCYKFVAGGIREETLWLLGSEGVDRLLKLDARKPDKTSVAFTSGGYYVMRDGWTRESNFLFFDCGPHGQGNCGHAHADALAIDVAAKGQTVLVDPGTCTYTGSKETRDWFRSSFAHNTLTIDDQSSSQSAEAFSWNSIARSECLSWISHDRFDFVAGAHDGFARLPEPAEHARRILFIKDNYWIIRDIVASKGVHNLRLSFHFDSHVAPLHSKENIVRIVSEKDRYAILQLATFAPGGQWTEESGWVSHCYGERVAAPVFAFSVSARGSQELITFLLPETMGATPKPSVRQIEALAGQAFSIDFDGRHDVLMWREAEIKTDPTWSETVQFASDFELVWARFERNDQRRIEELILIDGHTLEFEGRELLRSKKKIDYLVARRVEDRFRVETEEGVLELALPVMDLESLLGSVGRSQS